MICQNANLNLSKEKRIRKKIELSTLNLDAQNAKVDLWI